MWTGFLRQILKMRTLTIFCRLFFSPTKKRTSVIVCCFHWLTSDTGKVHAVHYNLQHQPSEQEGSGCFGLFTPAQSVNRKEVGVLDCSHQPSQWTGRKWVFWIVHTSWVNRKEVDVLDCSHQLSKQEGSWCFGLFTPAQWTGRKWVFWIVLLHGNHCSPCAWEICEQYHHGMMTAGFL